MAESELCLLLQRLKREDCKSTKYDSRFSKWKALVGPSDWEDYCRGKEGAARYRTHNLPTSSGPGFYELGIAKIPDPGLGRQVDKIDSGCVVVVYLGQAGDVRTRLQGYGRSGNHLGKNYSSGHTNPDKNVPCQKGSALFDEIFSRGYSIVFRWAPIGNKNEAEKTEARLLKRYDYAWNKGRNGPSRPKEVLEKLDSTSVCFPKITRTKKNSSQKPVGVKIKACKQPLLENESNSHNNESMKLLPQVFKYLNSRPRLVPVKSSLCSPFADLRESKVKLQLDADKYPVNGDLLPICGVTLDDGTCCTRPPVPGRVRCYEHKGRRKCENICNSTTKGNSTTKVKSSYLRDTCIIPSVTWNLQDENSICRVELGNGKLCRNQPAAGRQRCEEHKGLRVNSLVPKLGAKGNFYVPSVFDTSKDKKCSHASSRHNECSRPVCNDLSNKCGATTLEGGSCTRRPAEGSRQCWQHQGNTYTCSKPVYNDFSSICGAATLGGGSCTRRPAEGSRQCWQHQGNTYTCSKPVYNDFSSICGAATLGGGSCSRRPAEGSRHCWQHQGNTYTCSRPVYNDFSSICGATTRKGYPCTRQPAEGSRHCWQH